MHSVVVGDVCLGIACEVVFDDQDILHYRFLLHTDGQLHRDVVDVNQIQQLSAQDRLHRGYLRLFFKDAALRAVTHTHHHPLGLAWLPEPFPEQA